MGGRRVILSGSERTRFKRRIYRSIWLTPSGCWRWQKTHSRNGYGRFALGGGRCAGAHRVSYAAFVGPIPDGMLVCHRCDVRDCVNPGHLFLGTHSDNLLDASRKNRVSRTHQPKGSANPQAKLIEADIPVIRGLLSDGVSKRRIASIFGVTRRIILLISRHELWRSA